MTFRSPAERRAAFLHMQGRKVAPRRLLSQQGTAILKQAGYTSGLAPMPRLIDPMRQSQPKGLDLTAPARHALKAKQQRTPHALWQLAKIGGATAALGALPAGYVLMRTPWGRKFVARTLTDFHPLRPLHAATDYFHTLAQDWGKGHIRQAEQAVKTMAHSKIDQYFDKLVGVGDTPGLIDLADVKLKRVVRGLARRAGIPVSTFDATKIWQTQAMRTENPFMRETAKVWQDMQRTGQAEGRFTPSMPVISTPRGRKLKVKIGPSGGLVPDYRKPSYFQLTKLPNGRIRRRKLH